MLSPPSILPRVKVENNWPSISSILLNLLPVLILWFLHRTLCRRAGLQTGGVYTASTEKSPRKKWMGNMAARKLGGLHGESLKNRRKKKKASFSCRLNYGFFFLKGKYQQKHQNLKHIYRTFSETHDVWAPYVFSHPFSLSWHVIYFLTFILSCSCWTLDKI